MAGITVNSTNYNGDLNNFLYKVVGLGNDVVQKGAIHLKTGIASKEQLDYLEADADPFQDYTENAPTTPADVVKYKRDLTVKDMTLYYTMTPNEWMAVWEKYRSQGTFTQLSMNPMLLADVIEVVKNAANNQLAKLIWQGDVAAGGASPLRFFDGLIKLALADADVIDILTSGAITTANAFEVLGKMYAGTPSKYLEDPDFQYFVSYGTYQIIQQANIDVKKTSVGVLSTMPEDMYLSKKIVPMSGMPDSYIFGAKGITAERSNLIMGMYFDVDPEFGSIAIDKVENLGKKMGLRVDMKAGVQYRYGGDIVLYSPS